MGETVRCPGCDAELALTAAWGQEAKCPRCEGVFVPGRSSTAITATTNLRYPSHVNDPIDPPVVQPPPAGGWLTVAVSVTLAINIAVLALPAWYLTWDILLRELVPELWMENPLRLRQARVEYVQTWFFGILVTAVPPFLCFGAWYYLACRTLHRTMPERSFQPELAVALLLIPFVNVVALYVGLMEILRGSDPGTARHPDLRHEVKGIWLIHLWAFLLLLAPLLLTAAACLWAEMIAVFAVLSIAAAGVVLIAIIRDITRRQLGFHDLAGSLDRSEKEGI